LREAENLKDVSPGIPGDLEKGLASTARDELPGNVFVLR
jgi:hypothetical protein